MLRPKKRPRRPLEQKWKPMGIIFDEKLVLGDDGIHRHVVSFSFVANVN